MNEDKVGKVKMQEIVSLFDYFYDHPVMLAGVGISCVVMTVCMILDKKNIR